MTDRTPDACPVPSSVTGQPCLLPAGHDQDTPTRFHRYAVSPLRADAPPSPPTIWYDCPTCGQRTGLSRPTLHPDIVEIKCFKCGWQTYRR